MEIENIKKDVSTETGPTQRCLQLLKRYPLFVVSVILALLLLVMTILCFSERLGDTPLIVPEDIAELNEVEQASVTIDVLDALSAVMLLPDEANPIVATVTDSATLKHQQSFYAKVEDGDILIVFSTSRQAVIYRPSIEKIVNAGPLIINENAQ